MDVKLDLEPLKKIRNIIDMQNTIMVKKHFLCWEMRLNQKNL